MAGRCLNGTRFRVFPQFDEGYAEPETVVIDIPPGAVGPGPSDFAIYVANAVRKSEPYDPPVYLPPYAGETFPPAVADAQGHFDWIPVEAPQFRAAQSYALVRLNIDAWQEYLGRDIAWWFGGAYRRLEIVPLVAWNNAQSGPGYLETGRLANEFGQIDEFWMDADVLAHEVGHVTLFSTIGSPAPDSVHGAFLAFHEAFADLFALTGALRFRSVRTRLLEQTGGNLYVENLVSRIGELSSWTQIRVASNDTVMSDVEGITLAADGSWIDAVGRGRGVFALAEPLLGAMFDCLVEVFQDGLVARGLIAPDLVPADVWPEGWTRDEVAASLAPVRTESRRAFVRFAEGFDQSLEAARDFLCLGMAHVMRTIRPDSLTFATVAARFLEGAAGAGLGALTPELMSHFLTRGIDPRPHLPPAPAPRRPGRPANWNAVRTAPPPDRPHCRACGRADAFLLAGRIMRPAHQSRLCQ